MLYSDVPDVFGQTNIAHITVFFLLRKNAYHNIFQLLSIRPEEKRACTQGLGIPELCV